MDSSRLIDALLAGEMPDAQPRDLDAAVTAFAGELRHGAETTLEQVSLLAKRLNEHRSFDNTRLICEAWAVKGQPDATLDRHHAQALIELGALDAAEALLTRHRDLRDSAAEAAERSGLLGRIHKERFLATNDHRALQQSIEHYHGVYIDNPQARFWHGINIVALLARADREQIEIARSPGPLERIADDVLKNTIARWNKSSADPWLAATASEALLALGRCDEAELFLYRFLHHPRTTPFALNSYARQVREVWQGAFEEGCAGRLHRILTGYQLRVHRAWTSDARSMPKLRAALEANPEGFERNFLGDRMFTIASLTKLLTSCNTIGCVQDDRGVRMGTGFLIEGGSLAAKFQGRPVFVTNAHVLGSGGVPIDKARITFELASNSTGESRQHRVLEVHLISPPGKFGVSIETAEELDTTIVTLEDLPQGAECLRAAPGLPVLNTRSRAFVAGHPKGAALQVSLHDSELLDFDDHERLLHYRTPTEPGSSGSPVFNEQWEVIAVHHGGLPQMPRLHGSGQYEANEGIAIKAIQRKLAS